MRVLVTGSRDWPDFVIVWAALWTVHDEHEDDHEPMYDLTVVHGACPKGADAMASSWCRATGTKEERWPAHWDIHGKQAGPIRNAEMVDTKPDLVLAFIKDRSKGASHTLQLARDANIPYRLWEA